MKKITAAILLAITVFTLASCGEFVCGLCGEKKSGKSHKDEMLGQEIILCNDCYKGLKELAEGLADFN